MYNDVLIAFPPNNIRHMHIKSVNEHKIENIQKL